jgi:hypothetical protein
MIQFLENCRPATACVVDMYIDDKANLPWNNKARYASMYGRKSKGILRSQYPNDKPAYLYRRTKRGQQFVKQAIGFVLSFIINLYSLHKRIRYIDFMFYVIFTIIDRTTFGYVY